MRPFQRILHTLDLHRPSLPAFCHALKIALSAASKAEPSMLELFHCESDQPASFAQFPRVRQRLIRWGVLPEGAEKHEVVELGLGVRKQIAQGDVGEEIVLESEIRDFELLVMSSQAMAGWSYFLHRSVSASAIHNTQVPGLIFPPDVAGFVNANSGALQLSRVLLPVAVEPEAWLALQAVARLLLTLHPSSSGEIMLAYVGREQDFPEQNLPALPVDWKWTRKTLSGDPVPALSAWAQEWRPDLAALSSAGQQSWRDRWFGSTAEQLLKEFACPVLVAPSNPL